jgi:hypothetical protein
MYGKGRRESWNIVDSIGALGRLTTVAYRGNKTLDRSLADKKRGYRLGCRKETIQYSFNNLKTPKQQWTRQY